MAFHKQETIKKFLCVRLDRPSENSSSASRSEDVNGKSKNPSRITTSHSSSSLSMKGKSSEKSSSSSRGRESPLSKIKKITKMDMKRVKRRRARDTDSSCDEFPHFDGGSRNGRTNLDESDFSDDFENSCSLPDNNELKASGVQFESNPCSKITLTLDVLLADKIRQDELDRMNKDLQEHIRQGGITNMLAELSEPDELLPEHREKLEQLQEYSEFELDEYPPWEKVFEASHYCCLFSPSIYPNHFRFVPGKSKIDTTLAETKDVLTLDILLKSDMLRIGWYSVSKKPLILRWLFLIMSVHKEMAISDLCCKVIVYAIQEQRCSSRSRHTWAPEIADILRLFINYGACLEDLVPQKNLINAEDLRLAMLSINGKQKPRESAKHAVNNSEKKKPDSNPDKGFQEPHYKISNLENVLSVLAVALETRSSPSGVTVCRPPYTPDQLTALFLMLCKIRMDAGIATRSMVFKIQAVLSRIITKYTESDWPQTMMFLSCQLSMLIPHHHNMLFITETLPHCDRSIELRQRLATLQLHLTVGLDISNISMLPNLKISCLTNVIPSLRTFVRTELYKLYTAVDLLSIAVGDCHLQNSEREDLLRLMSLVTQLSEALRDNGHMIANSTVKSKLLVLSHKWRIFSDSLNLTQKSMFAYTRQQSLMAPMTIEMTTYDSDSDTDSDLSSSVSSIFSLPEI